jgi:hypothetical protein
VRVMGSGLRMLLLKGLRIGRDDFSCAVRRSDWEIQLAR